VVVGVVVVVGKLSVTLPLAPTGDGMAVVTKDITPISSILKDHRVMTTADLSLIRQNAVEAFPAAHEDI
jgi:hypothetical protein